ncbi:Major facilitator superfamily domain-containing protein 12 [Stylophora pistillata]|uniref:Major facilitator superfamily domain-containing protein 12 n=1 Tax=Stylophora pistillata TaxID=50429 RepID=A0A2B4SEC5_STYPI|nr:Major facilitator superfamily domain-containing protein 12 [Stylophora pistillata]
MFSFISGIFIYIVAWGLLGQDKSDDLGPHSLPEFLYLACILSGTGVFLAAIFQIGVREPKTRVRRKSTINSLMNAPGVFLNAFGSQNANTRRRSIAHNFIDMILATTQYEEKQSEMSGCEESRAPERPGRKRSLLQKFVEALFSDGETDNNSQSQDQLQSATEETTKNPKSEDLQTPMFLEVQHLDPQRKRSLLMRVLDGLVLRLQQEEQVQFTCINGIEDQIAQDGEDDECVTGENFWRTGQEEIESAPDESEWELTNDVGFAEDKNRNEEEGIDREDQNKTSRDDSTRNFPKQECIEELGNDSEDQSERIPETSFRTQCSQRKREMVDFPDGSKCGLSNSGFEDNESDGDRKRSLSNTLEGKRRKSVQFSSSEFSRKLSMNEKELQSLNLDYTPKKKTSLEECTQNFPKEDCREDEGIKACESRNDSSTGGDNPELLGVPVPLTNGERGPERKHKKKIKEWLRDPRLYKVAIIFACSRHALDLTNTYLPLFLTETLLLPKESTAYFPLILLISASLASSTSNKLNNKIGSKWSYLLAGLLVMGGAVWSYFQTVSTRQSFYAPVVIIGSVLIMESQESQVIEQFTSTTDGPESVGTWATSSELDIPEALKLLENSGVRFTGVPFMGSGQTKIIKDRSVYFSVDTLVTTQAILGGIDAAGIDIDSIGTVQRKSSNKSRVVSVVSRAAKEVALETPYVKIEGLKTFLGDYESRLAIVKVYEAPAKLPDTALIGRLSHYGRVLSFRRDMVAQHIENGVRTARMNIAH